MTDVIVVSVIGAIAVAFVGYLVYRWYSERQRVEAMSPVEKEAHEAEKDYSRLVSSWNKQVSKAERDLENVRNGASRTLGKYKGVSFSEASVTTPEGSAYFKEGPVSATVDTAGGIAVSQRITLTRLIAGGIIGGLIFPKKKVTDSRELYLLVQTPAFASLVECGPEDGPRVRQVANALNNAAASCQATASSRQGLGDTAL